MRLWSGRASGQAAVDRADVAGASPCQNAGAARSTERGRRGPHMSSTKRLSSRTAYIRSAGGSKDQLRVLRYWTTIPPTAATRASTNMNG